MVGWQGGRPATGSPPALGSAARGAWDGRGRCCLWGRGRRGFGTWWPTAGPGRSSCSTSTTPANRSGRRGSPASAGGCGAPGVGGNPAASPATRTGTAMLAEAGALPRRRGERGKIVRLERSYFARHASRMKYQALARCGWPIGNGAVESGGRTRPVQFWTKAGLRQLPSLEEARDNGHWDQPWLTTLRCGRRIAPETVPGWISSLRNPPPNGKLPALYGTKCGGIAGLRPGVGLV